MLTREKMQGVYALPPTPFTPSGEFDEDSFRHDIRTLADAGVDAIVTTGSNGEFHTMPWEMLQHLIRVLVDETPDNVVTVAGCSAVNTEDAILRTRFAMECGADAVMNVSPYYVDLTEEELITFWQDVSSACPDIGIIVYNNPTTAQLHTVPVFRELAKLPNLCGTKEGHTNFTLLLELMQTTDLSHQTSTELDWFVPAMQMGARGVFCMSAAIFPRFVVQLMEACKEKRWDEALAMQQKVRAAWDAMTQAPYMRRYNMIARFKAMVNASGHLRCGKNRKPLISVTDEDQERLREFCQSEFQDMVHA